MDLGIAVDLRTYRIETMISPSGLGEAKTAPLGSDEVEVAPSESGETETLPSGSNEAKTPLWGRKGCSFRL